MENLIKYCLRLGDNSLILSHRLGEYSSNGPFLEEDLAITNVALDHIGQAEAFFIYASQLEGKERTADDFAYRRSEKEYLNVQLVEQPNTDFAFVMARQFFIDVFNFYHYSALEDSADTTISAIAAKSIKEVTYHLRRSSEWMIRLGDGTAESHEKIQQAINDLWMYTGELFEMDETMNTLMTAKIAPNLKRVRQQWDKHVDEILQQAKLQRPENDYMVKGGRQGNHSEHLGHLLAEMQYLQRAYPNATW